MANHNQCNDAPSCPRCGIEPFSRNHYFTGKLLVERDFRDEQRYLIDKLRHHHQRLHGWGVVCGLMVTAYENPQCRDRFLCVEPGTAVDCCGHEILVPERHCLEALKETAVAALETDPNTDHRLQVCLHYRECPAEDIPVLYDECSCDDSRCAPNRILEGYRLELRRAPTAPEPAALREPGLAWRETLNVGNPGHMALHGNRLYVASWVPGNDHSQVMLYRFDTETCAEEASYPLGRQCRSLAVSADGTRLCVLVAPEDMEGPSELLVFPASNLAAGPDTQEIPNSDNEGRVKRLVPGADGTLHTLVVRATQLWHLVWQADMSAPPQVIGPCDLPDTKLGRTLFSSDLSRLYVSLPRFEEGEIRVFDTADLSLVRRIPLETAWLPMRMIPLRLGEAELLAIYGEWEGADGHYRPTLWLMDPEGASPMLGSLEVAGRPARLLTSPDGRWLFALGVDADRRGILEVVNAQALRDCRPEPPVNTLPIGIYPTDALISDSGGRVYAGFAADREDPETGGIARIHVTEGDCAEPLRQTDCPECGEDDCLVLATIEGYRYEDRLEDMPEAGGDAPDGQAFIDNQTGRRRLPSVQALAQAVHCLLEGGVVGSQGPPGQPGEPGEDGIDGTNGTNGINGTNGTDGLGIDQVSVEMVPCLDENGDRVDATSTLSGEAGTRTLHLTLPGSCNDALTHICAISWVHGGIRPPDDPQDEGGNRLMELLIRFDGLVEAQDLTPGALQLWFARPVSTGVAVWLQIRANPTPVIFRGEPCRLDLDAGEEAGSNGVRLVGHIPRRSYLTDYRVLVKGDFIRDARGRALDADHLPGWLPDRHTGDGIEGGTFESWFSVRHSLGTIGDIPIHEVATLLRTNRSTAERLVAHIEDNRIRSLSELGTVEGVSGRILERFRNGFSDQ